MDWQNDPSIPEWLRPVLPTMKVEEVLPVVIAFAKGFVPQEDCRCTIATNINTAGPHPDQTLLSFHRQHTGTPGFGAVDFRPGRVLDVLLNRAGNTFFASIFFDEKAKRVRYALHRLASQIEINEVNSEPRQMVFARETVGAVELDRGEIAWANNEPPTAIGQAIAGWLKAQITANADQ
jgi:hypothetical protein